MNNLRKALHCICDHALPLQANGHTELCNDQIYAVLDWVQIGAITRTAMLMAHEALDKGENPPVGVTAILLAELDRLIGLDL